MNDVAFRMYKWLENNIKKSKGSIFLVYTHGVAIKSLLSYIENWTHKKTFETEIDNTSISKIIIENDNLKIEYINKKYF